MFSKIFLFFFFLTVTHVFAETTSTGKHYVNTNALKVRTAPTTKSTHTYNIYRGYKVRVYELQNGWARITRYKTSTEDGKFIKKARWVYAKFITSVNAKKKRKNRKSSSKKTVKNKTSHEEALAKVLKPSDNYDKYAKIFQTASLKLIKEKRCRVNDFKKMRGWVEASPTTTYFTYCGGFKKTNKVYLNIQTGEISEPLRPIKYK